WNSHRGTSRWWRSAQPSRRRCRSSPSISTTARGGPPSTCLRWDTRLCGMWPVRRTGWRRGPASRAGGERLRRPASTRRPCRAAPTVLRGGWIPRWAYDGGRALIAEGGVPAVFVANDQMALGMLRAFTEAGITVPRDVHVVGFDDVREAAYFGPPLTTVRQDFI